MLSELTNFATLTKQEKFNLVNLPEVILASDAASTPESSTLCDICLVVPGIREWTNQGEVTRLCSVIYRFKRVTSSR